MRLHLRILREDQTGQQGGALFGRQRAQDVLEQQLGQQQLVAAYLTSYAAFQLHRPAAVDVLEGLKDLKGTRGGNKTLVSNILESSAIFELVCSLAIWL